VSSTGRLEVLEPLNLGSRVLTGDTGDCARGVDVSAGIVLLVRIGWRPLAALGAFSYMGSLSKPSLALIADISTWVALETVIVVFADLKRLGGCQCGRTDHRERRTK
jgi:hypothetical protein